mmetsp:Transcript_55667/g.104633  ORF Transcript_55667/g.104633 Transcript_55667/m.104633 type:complete len:133 (+) Transcript_55667:295-693(+)
MRAGQDFTAMAIRAPGVRRACRGVPHAALPRYVQHVQRVITRMAIRAPVVRTTDAASAAVLRYATNARRVFVSKELLVWTSAKLVGSSATETVPDVQSSSNLAASAPALNARSVTTHCTSKDSLVSKHATRG